VVERKWVGATLIETYRCNKYDRIRLSEIFHEGQEGYFHVLYQILSWLKPNLMRKPFSTLRIIITPRKTV
jgi:hypothetical protein